MNIYSSPSSISQYTALETFKYYSYFDDIVEAISVNRDFEKKNLLNWDLVNFIYLMELFIFI